jgi:predicted GIY-YIG superfamily endonuclease
MTTYLVYWIHYTSHTDPYSEGYVGVTNNLTKRKSAHKKNPINPIIPRALNKGAVFSILEENLTRDEALQLETGYRPTPRIAWNIAAGGLMPHDKRGMKYSEEHCRRISEGTKGLPKSQKDRERLLQTNTKQWIVTHPDGHEEDVTNLNQFCMQHKLTQSCMSAVSKGQNTHHKGFAVRAADVQTCLRQW